MTYNVWSLTTKKKLKKSTFSIEFLVNKTWDPPMGLIGPNVLNIILIWLLLSPPKTNSISYDIYKKAFPIHQLFIRVLFISHNRKFNYEIFVFNIFSSL